MYLYGADSSNGANLDARAINPTTGALTTIGDYPVVGSQNRQQVAVDPSGRFVYATNYTPNSLSGYALNPANGALTHIATTPDGTTSASAGIAIDPAGKFIFSMREQVRAHSIDAGTGALTVIATYPYNVKFGRFDPAGKFLYLPGESIQVMSMDSATGALTPAGIYSLPGGLFAQSIVFRP
jgi:6-phosphogluconolactonase (cycloisomerase 2 family)